MTDESFASFFSRPLGVTPIAATVAAITARLSVGAMFAQRRCGHSPIQEQAWTTATIAAAIAASFGASRIPRIGIVPSGHAREPQFPASTGALLL
ncbi:MAG: hypothetical protein R3D62_06260 [Xanthobacteraceae bacterium]